jgi:uncharacterized protein (TIGR04255 family)
LLPVALKRDTIQECIFEMRFGVGHPSLPDLLPGLLFGRLSNFFQGVATLPFGQVPKMIRDQNPMLQYAHTHALMGDRMRLMIGHRAVAVSFDKPYLGWARVQPQIIKCIGAVIDTKMIGKPERFAIKYVNLLQYGATPFDIRQTTLELKLGSFPISGQGTLVHTEIALNDCVSLVDIQTGVSRVGPLGQPLADQGILLSVDTIRNAGTEDVSGALPDILETLHHTEKEIFFGLLAPETLQKLEPIYPTKQ